MTEKQSSEAMMSLLKSAVNMRCFTMDRMEAVLVKNNENEKAANSGKKPKFDIKIPDEATEKIVTVADAVNEIKSAVK